MSLAQLHATSRGNQTILEVPVGRWLTIGRSSASDLQVRDETISRQHCRVRFDGSSLTIEDLDSVHGVLQKGLRVAQCSLQVGDSCHLGTTVLQFTGIFASPTPAVPKEPEPVPEAINPQDPRIGLEIGGYQILSRLGKGGSATVYRAHQQSLHRDVALKVLDLPTDAAQHEPLIAAFLREARAAAALTHSALLQVYDVGSANGETFLAMELATLGTLSAQIRLNGPLRWKDLEPIARDLAAALQCAHDRGILHKDVKPANVLLTEHGVAKLGDLGLAGVDARAGTLAFMAPEQLRGQTLSTAADLYGLGCTLYAALAGQPPFAGDKKTIARGHLHEAVLPLGERGVVLPAWVDDLVCNRLLAKDPAQRIATGNDLLAALDEGPRNELRPNSQPRYRSPAKQFLAALAAQSVVFVIVAVLVVVMLLALKKKWPECDIYRLLDWFG